MSGRSRGWVPGVGCGGRRSTASLKMATSCADNGVAAVGRRPLRSRNSLDALTRMAMIFCRLSLPVT